MFKKVYYVIGSSDECDEFFEESLVVDDPFTSLEEAEKEIQRILDYWGDEEGYTREDYDIAKITVTIERGIK